VAKSAAPAGPAKPLAAVGLEPPPLPRFEQWGPVERVPLSHLRRTIAERMTLSASLIPHVTHFDRADITDLDAIITRNLEPARAKGVTLTLTGFLLKAAALALGRHPQFNASLDPAAGEMIVKRYCHLGVAVATERGLIVPVIRDVAGKPVLELARELGALAQISAAVPSRSPTSARSAAPPRSRSSTTRRWPSWGWRARGSSRWCARARSCRA